MISAKEAAERAREARMPKTINGMTFDEAIERQNKAIMDAISKGRWNTVYLFNKDEYWEWSSKADDYYLRKGLGYSTFRLNGVCYIAW